MCHLQDRQIEAYGARMQRWTDDRATLLLAIRQTYRPVPRWLVWLVWLARWWEAKNEDRLGCLREELFHLEDRRPLHPEARDPVETRLLGGPVYPRWDGTTEVATVRLPRLDDITLQLHKDVD